VQRIRDEAHRFAITYHRAVRSKSALASVFDEVPGIGPTIARTIIATAIGSPIARPFRAARSLRTARAQRRKVRLRTLDLTELVREVVGRYQEQLTGNGHLLLDIVGSPGTVSADPDRMSRCWTNLLTTPLVLAQARARPAHGA
jgi:hypothetical protein